MFLLLRLLPYLVGIAQVFLFLSQTAYPRFYPWLVIVGVFLVPAASLLIAWKHVRAVDVIEKMTPTFLLILALGFGLLLAESRLSIWTIALIAGFASAISLELLFLWARHPSAYPVNGLSHVNIAYVPLGIWYASYAASGLLIFLHASQLWYVGILGILGALLFRTTGHPGATTEQQRVWMGIGGLVGIEVGWIGTLLPLSMNMQGCIAALVICAVLRVRRYVYDPVPSSRLAWSEAVIAIILFIGGIASAKWL
ncbi:hypothetical protein KBC54_01030 [Patescibacteria group bacterium]|nr:hypothetical protein [Patescibacteria group bacterium]